jgi:hypothetical protein
MEPLEKIVFAGNDKCIDAVANAALSLSATLVKLQPKFVGLFSGQQINIIIWPDRC